MCQSATPGEFRPGDLLELIVETERGGVAVLGLVLRIEATPPTVAVDVAYAVPGYGMSSGRFDLRPTAVMTVHR